MEVGSKADGPTHLAKPVDTSPLDTTRASSGPGSISAKSEKDSEDTQSRLSTKTSSSCGLPRKRTSHRAFGEKNEPPADSDEDRDNEFGLDLSLPINSMSADEDIPGQLTVSLSRMRGTINGYTEQTCSVNWVKNFKWATVKALQCRHDKYESAINGHSCVDLEVSYKQLRLRCASMLQLHKKLEAWGHGNKIADLVSSVQNFGHLMKWHEYNERTFAPDLCIILQYAKFHQRLSLGRSVSQSIDALDVEGIVIWRRALDESDVAVEQPGKMGVALAACQRFSAVQMKVHNVFSQLKNILQP